MEAAWHCENATSAKMRDIDDTLSFDLLCSLYSLAVIDFIIVFIVSPVFAIGGSMPPRNLSYFGPYQQDEDSSSRSFFKIIILKDALTI